MQQQNTRRKDKDELQKVQNRIRILRKRGLIDSQTMSDLLNKETILLNRRAICAPDLWKW